MTTSGDLDVISFVEECAWWTREYKKSIDFNSVSDSTSTHFTIDTVLGSMENLAHNKAGHQRAHNVESGDHDLHDWFDFDDWARWLAKTSRTGPGLLIFLCWVSVFAYYMCKCPNRRPYVKLKRDEREAL